MVSTSDKDKGAIVQYLLETFHQGGFLNPVSSALAVSMREEGEVYDKETRTMVNGLAPYATVKDPKKTLHILTTPTGMRVQEFVVVEKIIISHDLQVKMQMEENPILVPDTEENNFCIKAQGTINVDFSRFKENNSQPSIQVESNTISYGNAFIENKLDNRNLGQMIVDFLKRVLGLNSVKDISPVLASSSKPTDDSQVLTDSSSENDDGSSLSPGHHR